MRTTLVAFVLAAAGCDAGFADQHITLGEHAELVCFRLAECTTRPMALDGGLDEPIDVHDPVECVRAVRAGWSWLDNDGAERVLGDEPADGYGSERCQRALERLPCPMVEGYVPALEVVLNACSD